MTSRRVLALLSTVLLAGAGAPQSARQERLLTGISAEGASVTADRENGIVRRIRVEALNEGGYTLSDYRFGTAGLAMVRIRRYRYMGDPGAPHRSGIVDRTDVLLSNEQFRFASGRLTGWRVGDSANVQARAAEARADAAEYLAFMNTPLPTGGVEGGAWSCVHGPGDRCAGFTPDAPSRVRMR